jgi:hypothetical protein
MNEYPHIYHEMKKLAYKRELRDLNMIEDSLMRRMQPEKYAELKKKEIKREESPDPTPEEIALKNEIMTTPVTNGDSLEKLMVKIRKSFQDSICTEVDNHEIVPLPQMFEEMKEKLPLEELLDNFEVSKSGDEEEEEDLDNSDVKFSDVMSIGLQKMYSQFQDLNQSLKNKIDLEAKIEVKQNKAGPGARRGRMGTFIDNTKDFVRKRDSSAMKL